MGKTEKDKPKKVKYKVYDNPDKVIPTQDQFSELLLCLRVWDIDFQDFLNQLEENYVFDRIATNDW